MEYKTVRGDGKTDKWRETFAGNEINANFLNISYLDFQKPKQRR